MKRLALALVLFVLCAAPALAGMRLLAPAEGYRAVGGQVWVVVSADAPPKIILDGKAVKAESSGSGGVYHLLVSGLKRDASLIEIRSGGEVAKVTVQGPGVAAPPAPLSFHAKGVSACVECHQVEGGQCRDCHDFGGHKHAKKLKCELCHDKPGAPPAAPARTCTTCHAKYSPRRHPKLKHAVSGDNDPRRPGRGLDCVSCHDPHRPRRLGKLSKKELRQWCQECHSN